MSSKRLLTAPRARALPALAVLAGLLPLALTGCTLQPLYGTAAVVEPGSETFSLSSVGVGEVDSRVGQQVRNHLLFMMHGGNDPVEHRHEVRLQVTSFEKQTSSHTSLRDTTAGTVTVNASYNVFDARTQERLTGGTRSATASFDRTSQSFANERAVRDAENRAGRDVAEQLRFAILADLRRLAAESQL